MSTATAEKPVEKVEQQTDPRLSTTGQLEMNADLFVRAISALNLFTSGDWAPLLSAIHMFGSDDGQSATFYATDSYKLAKVTLPCEVTPKLENSFRVDSRDIKSLAGKGAGNVIMRVGQVGDFNLSSVGHWTGRGVHLSNEQARLAFGSVLSPDKLPNFEKLITDVPDSFAPATFSTARFAEMCKASDVFARTRPQRCGTSVAVQSLDAFKPCRFESRYGDHRMLMVLMPVRTGAA